MNCRKDTKTPKVEVGKIKHNPNSSNRKWNALNLCALMAINKEVF